LLPGAVSGWSECAETFLVEYIRAKAGGAGYTAIPYKDYALCHNQIDYNGRTAIGLHAVLIKISRDEIWYRYSLLPSTLLHVYLNNGRLTYIYVDKP
jgi:hypothetical protein